MWGSSPAAAILVKACFGLGPNGGRDRLSLFVREQDHSERFVKIRGLILDFCAGHKAAGLCDMMR
jgi:hypothetical protein